MVSIVDDSPHEYRVPFRKALSLVLFFGALGYLGNSIRLPLGFNLSFIFGSIFTLLCTVLLGWRWGLGSTLLASLYTYFLWNHPYAICIFAAETLWTGLALRRGHRNLVLIVTFYWLLVGIPLVFLFYGGVQHLGMQTTLATALKQAINGFLNALMASALLRYLPIETWLGLGHRLRRYPLGTVIYDATLLLLLVPSMGMIITLSHREISLGERRMVDELTTEAVYREGVVRRWVEGQLLALAKASEAGRQLGLAPSPRLQERLQQIHEFCPDLINLFLCDVNGKAVAFEPLVNDLGENSIGLEFSDHSYFPALKTTLKPVISEIFIGRRAAHRPIFTLSVPLLEEGRFQGFASGAVNLDDLLKALTRSQGEDPPFLTLLDVQNKVVVTTEPRWHAMGLLAETPGTLSRRITNQVELYIPPTPRNVSVMESWKAAHYVTRLPVRGTPWTLAITRPAGPLQERTFNLVTWTLAGLGSLCLAILLVATLMARTVSRALVRLAVFSKNLPDRIERGEDLDWPETRFEEIAEMTSHFRTTSAALGERIAQLKLETERRLEFERAMIHQSRLAAMGEMIGHIAHQWRQPLNSLSMLLANLRDAWRHGDVAPESLEQSFSRGETLIQKMSSTISDFSNFFSPCKEKVAFSAVHQIQEAIELVGASFKAADISLHVEPTGEVMILGFPNEFSQVVLNLMNNARQAIEETHASDRHIWIRLTETEGCGCLSVRDTGGGIPEDVLDRIFEPYFTTRERGTGIGLYMSRHIVEESLGGCITARNIEGGAEFTVNLPIAGGKP